MTQIIRTVDLAQRLGVSKQTLWRLSKDPTFPKKVKISQRAVGWKVSEIEIWIQTNQERYTS